MLQQTQVDRVVPRYRAFLLRFPTARACADAPLADVIQLWDGLGYNRRARNLHAAAVALRDEHGGVIPDSLDALLALPGVGPYTARAVLTFAFERDVGVVDTNVGRILARLVGRKLRPAEAQALADELVPNGQSWAWNQALFDIGSALCGKRSTQCELCPCRSECVWRGDVAKDDPAVHSAGVSGRQSTFEGSDRQGRGRLVARLRSGPIPCDEVAAAMGWPNDPERAGRVLQTLEADGLVEQVDGSVALPGSA